MSVIALDADGVLFDFDQSWWRCAEKVLKRQISIQESCYHLRKRYGLTKEEEGKVWALWNATAGWRYVLPILPGISAARMALDLGHTVHIVSHVPNEQAARERRESLDRWGLQGATLHPAYSGKKREILERLQPDFYADDCAVHCQEAVEAGVPRVARIFAWGSEPLPAGVQEHPSVAIALQNFLKNKEI